MTSTEKFDVVIVGGGISGLYTAWRLASNTTYSIAVLEYSNRFGGRYRTCQMPGGFPAELGAMRFFSKWHPILSKLINEMGLETYPYYKSSTNEHISAYFVRGQLVKNNIAEVSKIYNLSDSEQQHYIGLDSQYKAMELPENGNFFASTLSGSDQLARNVTLKQWWGESLNSGVIEQQRLLGHSGNSVASEAGIRQPFCDPDFVAQLKCIQGGMENLIAEIASRLKKLNVTLLKDHAVTRVEEVGKGFRVKAAVSNCAPSWFSADKLIMACNARGLELITWISDLDRTTQIQKLLGHVGVEKVTKLYLTYSSAWWEETSGISYGNIVSDLPISYISLYGSGSAAKNERATILLYNFVNAEVFDGMNSEEEERFENTEEGIPPEHVPSKVLVQNVQMQLKKVFGVSKIPPPVAACISTWNKDPIAYAFYVPKVGINHNSLYWRSLRPFGDDSNVFLIGDMFTAVDRNTIYTAWSEGALLTAERVLHKYFSLQPYLDGLCLDNPWPEDD